MQHGNMNVMLRLDIFKLSIIDSELDLKNSLYNFLFHQKLHVIIRCTFERKQPDIPGKQDCRSSQTIKDTFKSSP